MIAPVQPHASSVPACRECGAPAVILYPGDAGSTTLFKTRGLRAIDDFALRRPVDGFGLCAEHGFTDAWRASFRPEKQRAAQA